MAAWPRCLPKCCRLWDMQLHLLFFSWVEVQLLGIEASLPGQAPPAGLDALQQGSGVRLEAIGWLLLVYNRV